MALFDMLPKRTSEGFCNASSSAETVAAYFDEECRNKHVVITGARLGGLGFETARAIALQGAVVTLCCRNKSQCDEAVDAILSKLHSLSHSMHSSIYTHSLYLSHDLSDNCPHVLLDLPTAHNREAAHSPGIR
jgi:NAD(P)-dependent dehydrogenase (short-subunit alcohol dehydrogenase family)